MKCKSTISGERQRVVLSGDLVADAAPALKRLLGEITQPAVDLDCTGIRQINSTGVRVWSQFLVDLRGRAAYRFHNCPVFFIDYANLIPDLLRGGTVDSFEVPLRCRTCNRSETLMMDAAVARTTRSFAEHACGKCQRPMQPEVAPEDYLAFLESV